MLAPAILSQQKKNRNGFVKSESSRRNLHCCKKASQVSQVDCEKELEK